MTHAYDKPLPRPADWAVSRPYWEGARRGELQIQRCVSCDRFFFYPRATCPSCLGSDLEWQAVSGRGRVHTFTVVHQPAHPGFRDDAPYVYAIVELDEGPRMASNVVGCATDAVAIGMPVVAVFDDVTPDWTLVKFRPADA